MYNNILEKELNLIVSHKNNLIISKGDISGNSIDVEWDISSDSYIYYDNSKQRDSDFKELNEFINKI